MKRSVALSLSVICVFFYFTIDYSKAEPQIARRLLKRGRDILNRGSDRSVDISINRRPLNADIRLAVEPSRGSSGSGRRRNNGGNDGGIGTGRRRNNGGNDGGIDTGRRRNNGGNTAGGRRNNGGIGGEIEGGRRRNNGLNKANGRKNNRGNEGGNGGDRRRNNGDARKSIKRG